ncbi:hypothetical protein DL96DRAFT_1667954 [Flagelloscypha sp. PMI_526]|nr:hypothetical protein DL96DRAFT_1667954 [Flagelloscypha sp. PMI_526]
MAGSQQPHRGDQGPPRLQEISPGCVPAIGQLAVWRAADIPVFKPGDEDYERSVATSNLLFRFSRPACVVQPKTSEQVQKIIERAASGSPRLKITIKKMDNVDLNIENRIVIIDGGCSWGNVYKKLINGHHDTFVINGGRCPSVGVGGFILGGGLGPFSRTIGMGSDTLKAAEIITADGKLVTVKDTDSPDSKEGQLFWALKGAGGGNFGVVTKMTLSVHQLSHPQVVAGRYQWFPRGGITKKVVEVMNKIYMTDWLPQLTLDSTWMCDLRQSSDGVRFLTYFDGEKTTFDQIIDENIQQSDLKENLKRRSLPEPSTRFLHETLVAQWSEETVRAFPTNKTYSIFSSFVFHKNAQNISKVTSILRELMRDFREQFDGERVEFLATFIHIGGKSTEFKPKDSAFFWREAIYQMYLTVEWEDKWMEYDMRHFLGTVKGLLRPLSLNGIAAYINFPDGAFPKEQHEKAYFGDNHQKLREVKKIWDPTNFFDWEYGVKLPTAIKRPPTNDKNSSGSTIFETKELMKDMKTLK